MPTKCVQLNKPRAPDRYLLPSGLTVRPLKPPPDRVPVIASGEHKILCRGQKPNYGVRERQASLLDFIESFLYLFFSILRHYAP
jgi:hypothetical protein